MMSAAPGIVLVDPEISRRKLRRELALWQANSQHQERGWILLRYDEAALVVEVAFLARLSLSVGSAPLPFVASAVRLCYDNYDVWPPSLTFIDALTRKPTMPPVRAFMSTPEGPRDVLINSHPDTGLPFLCVAGIREYHSHPQHTGDDWLLHRRLGEGSISTVCDRVWRYMARNIVGLTVQLQAMPTWPLQAQLVISIGQGDVGGRPQPSPEGVPAVDAA
jgi:hypothetical protein